jgi:RNA polymerase sigma-70 factor, ECF subfamily
MSEPAGVGISRRYGVGSGAEINLSAQSTVVHSADPREFSHLTERYRRELQAHCYRIMGSLHDAEDLVQETYLRAWRRLDSYEGRSSIRAWLYKIATNACFDALAKRPRRALVPVGQPPANPHDPPAPAITEPVWLEPFPDEWLAELEMENASGPEASYAAHESITLAFMVALQALPPRQRAVLILRDVLDWQAREVAEMLDLTVSAVNSALHRARVTLARNYHRDGLNAAPSLPSDPALQAVLDRYVRAWEAADVAMLVSLLKEDASLAMPPSPTWFQGRAAIGAFFESMIFSGNAPGTWRLQPTRANGQPAFGVYQRAESGVYRAFSLQILTLSAGADAERVGAITSFLQPDWLRYFKLPDELAV